MTRAVVFRTPGKLDLRSLTIFGLNSKPNVTNPIGYFGTGLKYAMAVLMRERIPVTIWVGSTKWVIETEDTKFRDKDFQSIVLTRHRKLLPPQKRVLPFTTELGKNWTLWQAYREIESNTLDEKGETYIREAPGGAVPDVFIDEDRGWQNTHIIVEGEKFVEEHLQREKTFLPEALRQQDDGDAPIQVFQRRSHHLYYRGIRVMELEAPSEVTYNILQRIELTEDRTVASKYTVQWMIERFLAEKASKEVVKSVITAPKDSWERRNLDFDTKYMSATPSKQFEEAHDEAPAEELTSAAKQFVKKFRPEPEVIKEPWIDELISKVEDWADGAHSYADASVAICDIAYEHRKRLVEILKQAVRIEEPKLQPESTGEEDPPPRHSIDMEDEIPY